MAGLLWYGSGVHGSCQTTPMGLMCSATLGLGGPECMGAGDVGMGPGPKLAHTNVWGGPMTPPELPPHIASSMPPLTCSNPPPMFPSPHQHSLGPHLHSPAPTDVPQPPLRSNVPQPLPLICALSPNYAPWPPPSCPGPHICALASTFMPWSPPSWRCPSLHQCSLAPTFIST